MSKKVTRLTAVPSMTSNSGYGNVAQRKSFDWWRDTSLNALGSWFDSNHSHPPKEVNNLYSGRDFYGGKFLSICGAWQSSMNAQRLANVARGCKSHPPLLDIVKVVQWLERSSVERVMEFESPLHPNGLVAERSIAGTCKVLHKKRREFKSHPNLFSIILILNAQSISYNMYSM